MDDTLPRSPRSTTASQVLRACEDEEIFSPISITSPRVKSEDESEEDVEGTNDVEGTDRTDWAAASDGAHLSAGPSREPCVGMLPKAIFCKVPGCKNDRKTLCEHGKCSSCCRRGRFQFGHECPAHEIADLELEPHRNISGGSVRLHGKASRPNRRRGKASRAEYNASRAQFGHECPAHEIADLELEPRRNISGGSVRVHGKASRPNNESLKRNRRRGKASRAKFLARL